MRVGPCGQVIQRLCGGLVELLQHEQLGAGHAEILFGPPGGFAQALDDPANPVEHGAHIAVLRCIGSHILSIVTDREAEDNIGELVSW